MVDELKKFLADYERDIAESADRMRDEKLQPITHELFDLFEKDGSRIPFENVYFHRRGFLAVFGMASILWRKPEDIKKLCEVMEDICTEFCWALPAHVHKDKHPDDWTHTVDLFASETASAMGEIIGLLGDALPANVAEHVKNEILERVIVPFESSPVPYDFWENGSNNWNAVCSGSVGCAAIRVLADMDPERLNALLERLQSSLVYYRNGFSKDGACMEGLGYFTYGMSFYAAFAQELEAYTGGKVDLMAGEQIKKIMEFQQKCYFPGGPSISFSDGDSNEHFRVGLTCYLAMKDPDVRFPTMDHAASLHSDSCYRWESLYRDYIVTKEYIEQLEKKGEAEPEEKPSADYVQYRLTDAQWSICSGAHLTGLACKGGHNEEPHNHNDVGSFHYAIGDEVFLDDLGAGEYTREYFRAATRYTFFVNQSESHNVPLISGKGQLPGEEYHCTSFHADGKGYTCMRLEKAYDEPDLKSFERCLRFHPETGVLTVSDAFEAEETAEKPPVITESLITKWPPVLQGRYVLLKGEHQSCRLSLPENTAVQVSAVNYSDHKGIQQTVYLLRWDVPWKENKASVSFTAEPVE